MSPCHFSGISPGQFTGMSPCQFTGMSPCHFSGMSPCQFTGMSPCHFSGMSPCQFTGMSPGQVCLTRVASSLQSFLLKTESLCNALTLSLMEGNSNFADSCSPVFSRNLWWNRACVGLQTGVKVAISFNKEMLQ